MSLAALRAQLAAVIAPPVPAGETIATGISALDAVLPGGGIPCGRLTEVAGPDGSGATTFVHAVVAATLADKRWVAYIDASRTLAPADWAPLAGSGRLWTVRPPASASDHGAWCADILLRSGAFGLVVLDDRTPIARSILVRLTRLAKEGNAAFLILHHQTVAPGLVGSALRLSLQRNTPAAAAERPAAWRRIETRLTRAAQGLSLARDVPSPEQDPATPTFTCTVTKGGGARPHSIEVTCAFSLAHRLCTNPAIPDRRGVATRNRLGERAAPDAPGLGPATPPPDGVGGTALPRKRRCAEPATSREHFLLDRRQPERPHILEDHTKRQTADGTSP